MSVLAVGMSHRTADMRVLERAAVPAAEVGKVLDELLRCENVSEAMLVSTCNRVEVYAVVRAFHAGLADIVGVLARHSGVDPQASPDEPTESSLHDHLYVHYAAAAAEHLFRVTAGLDSMVVGEAQILGQVRGAYATAREARTVGRTLHELVQQALRVGKRVHSETGLDAVGGSVVAEALADADAVLRRGTAAGGGLAGRRALVVGAGSMGGLAAAALRRAGIGEVVIANRTAGNGARLADNLAAQGVPARWTGLSAIGDELADADVVISCTGAMGTVIDLDTVAGARREHPDRTVVFCDLGLPRDIDAGVAGLPGVTVIDLESLQQRLAGSPAGLDTRRASELVVEELRAYLAAQRSAEVTPTVTALRKRAAEVIDTELLRLDSRLPELSEPVRAELARTVRRVVDKLLHTPTVRVKELASGPAGAEYADALRELFQLDLHTPTVLSRPFTTAERPPPEGGER